MWLECSRRSRKFTAVTSLAAGRSTVRPPISRLISAGTLGNDLSSAVGSFVGKDSRDPTSSSDISALTRGRKDTAARSVRRDFFVATTWPNTSKPTRREERSAMERMIPPCLPSPPLDSVRLRIILFFLVRNVQSVCSRKTISIQIFLIFSFVNIVLLCTDSARAVFSTNGLFGSHYPDQWAEWFTHLHVVC